MQIDTQVPTPLKPANTYPQQTVRVGTSHSIFRYSFPIFSGSFSNYYIWSPTILNMWYLSHHATITTQECLIINPTRLELFTAAMAAGKQAWDWRIVVILMLSEKACLHWDGMLIETHKPSFGVFRCTFTPYKTSSLKIE